MSPFTHIFFFYFFRLLSRTKALHTEKKRTEILLYQMLPKSVAEKLKQNENVGAEHFSNVTVFFSDVEDFTCISARSSPIQVIIGYLQLFFSTLIMWKSEHPNISHPPLPIFVKLEDTCDV